MGLSAGRRFACPTFSGATAGSSSGALHLLAVSCLETAPELSPALRSRVRAAAAELLPPTNVTTARALAAAGSFVLDLLVDEPGSTVREVAAIIRTVTEIGDPAGISLLERYVEDERGTVRDALLTAWATFDSDEYTDRIALRMRSPLTTIPDGLGARQAITFIRRTKSNRINVGEGLLWDRDVRRALRDSRDIRQVSVRGRGPLGARLLTRDGTREAAAARVQRYREVRPDGGVRYKFLRVVHGFDVSHGEPPRSASTGYCMYVADPSVLGSLAGQTIHASFLYIGFPVGRYWHSPESMAALHDYIEQMVRPY